MAAQATHPGMQVPSGVRSFPARLSRRRVASARHRGRPWVTGAGSWAITAGLAAVSTVGAVVLLTAFAPGRNAVAIVAVVAAIATGALAHLAPQPPASEVVERTRGEAF